MFDSDNDSEEEKANTYDKKNSELPKCGTDSNLFEDTTDLLEEIEQYDPNMKSKGSMRCPLTPVLKPDDIQSEF